jgi:hypothetical protein
MRARLASILVAAFLGVGLPCHAADPAPVSATGTAPGASVGDSLPVTIKLVSTAIQAEEIRTAIESELRVAVRVVDVPPSEGLEVAIRWRRATVSFRSKQNETTTRSLDLPANSGQAVEVIALLAGNLARDEASELLSRLAPPPSAATPTDAAATPESPPPETPAPAPEAKEPPKTSDEKKPAPKKTEAPKPSPDDLIRGSTAVANLSLYHPVTLIDRTEKRVVNFELGAAYSRVGAIEGAGFTIGYLRVEKHVRGAVGTFGYTRVDGDVRGLQLGGFFTEGHGAIHGLDMANFGALRWGNVEGVQMSGFVGRADDVSGLQLSGLVTLADDVEGAQAALVTVAKGVRGVQLEFVGVAQDVRGAQLGLVNVAKSVDFQLGLVNVAERVDGAAIGLVSIAGNGYVQPTAYAIGGSRVSYNAGVKFVAGLAYTVLAAGATGTDSDARFRSEVGGGLHVEPPLFRDGPVVDRTSIEIGAHVAHTYLPQSEQAAGEEDAIHYRVGVGVRFVRAVWLLGGYDVSHDLSSPASDNIGHGAWGGVAFF